MTPLLHSASTPFGKWLWRPGVSRGETNLHQDFLDLLSVFADESVRYLIIGGYAVSYYDRPRYTKDLDLWVESHPENLQRVYRALARFGAPQHVLQDLQQLKPDEVLWMGNPPLRIDILLNVDGVNFSESFARHQQAEWHGIAVRLISRQDLIASKRAAGRPQDLVDADNLEQDGLEDF